MPYHITTELKEKGWKGKDDGVYIYWPFSKENNP